MTWWHHAIAEIDAETSAGTAFLIYVYMYVSFLEYKKSEYETCLVKLIQ